jgi:hypothetical protein
MSPTDCGPKIISVTSMAGLDTSDQTPAQTVDEIISRLDQAHP